MSEIMIKKSEVKRISEFFSSLQELEEFSILQFLSYIDLKLNIRSSEIIIVLKHLDMIREKRSENSEISYNFEFRYWDEQKFCEHFRYEIIEDETIKEVKPIDKNKLIDDILNLDSSIEFSLQKLNKFPYGYDLYKFHDDELIKLLDSLNKINVELINMRQALRYKKVKNS